MTTRLWAGRLWAGGTALLVLVALSFGSLLAIVCWAGGFTVLRPADWHAVRFTLTQSFVSAVLSVALAIPTARALARRQFIGRNTFVALLGLPFILPTLVAVMGLIAVFGRSGIVNAALGKLGFANSEIYGIQGVVLAHVFLNMPLATRLILNGWATIPIERFRLAESLGFSSRDVARFIELPMLRAVLPGGTLAIFLICLTSFSVALIMGGGPRATTLELAIYQSFRFEFDLGHAASLACLQMAISLVAAAICLGTLRVDWPSDGIDHKIERWGEGGFIAKGLDTGWLCIAALFLALPIASVLTAGLPYMIHLPASVWLAAVRSVCVALVATLACLSMALAIALLISGLRGATGRIVDAATMLMLTTSPLVLGTGLFLILRLFTDPVGLALPITALVNAALTLPFCLRAILPALREIEVSYSRLSDSLDIRGFAYLRIVVLPLLARPLGFGAGLASALSMGDFGVIALFADPQSATLPMQVYGLISAYRTDQAAAAAIVLMAISFTLFWLFDKLGRRYAAT